MVKDNNKLNARAKVNAKVKRGTTPNPNTLPCVDCGHLGDDRRHEYDHHLGYEPEYHHSVQPVCSVCHHKRDDKKMKQTHCIHGHEFTAENTIIKTNGCRACRECRKAFDRKRGRDAAYWAAYRAKRRLADG